MTQVDFYEVAGDELTYACRLIEKAWQSGFAVYAHVADAAAAARLDEHLWVFRADSFVPHAVQGAGAGGGAPAPVRIGHGGAPEAPHEALVNLADAVPDFFADFTRVAELVPADAARRGKSRARYAFYKEQGLSPGHHKQPAPAARLKEPAAR